MVKMRLMMRKMLRKIVTRGCPSAMLLLAPAAAANGLECELKPHWCVPTCCGHCWDTT
jgi:hypothetical protein